MKIIIKDTTSKLENTQHKPERKIVVVRTTFILTSSANSLTFHGYKVVMAISAACKSAKPKKSPKKTPNNDRASFFETGATGPFDTPPMAPIARDKAGRAISTNATDANARKTLRKRPGEQRFFIG
jgi:hypothetical protein